MTINSKIRSSAQKLTPGNIVELFDVDTTVIGGDTIYHFTPVVSSGTSAYDSIYFNGVEYAKLPCEFSGYEITSEGKLPRPTFTVSNVSLTFAGVVIDKHGLAGAKVTRRRTFECFLDGYPLADTEAQMEVEVFRVRRRVKHNRERIEWELGTKLDDENLYLPKEQVLQDFCPYKYRTWDATTSGFVYQDDQRCPYGVLVSGTNYFDKYGNSVVDPAEDKCGKHRYDCEVRFPNTTVPFGGCPGAGTLKPPYRN